MESRTAEKSGARQRFEYRSPAARSLAREISPISVNLSVTRQVLPFDFLIAGFGELGWETVILAEGKKVVEEQAPYGDSILKAQEKYSGLLRHVEEKCDSELQKLLAQQLNIVQMPPKIESALESGSISAEEGAALLRECERIIDGLVLVENYLRERRSEAETKTAARAPFAAF
jgi:hypothetical protein